MGIIAEEHTGTIEFGDPLAVVGRWRDGGRRRQPHVILVMDDCERNKTILSTRSIHNMLRPPFVYDLAHIGRREK